MCNKASIHKELIKKDPFQKKEFCPSYFAKGFCSSLPTIAEYIKQLGNINPDPLYSSFFKHTTRKKQQ